MKAFGLWVLLLMFGTALICLSFPPFPGNQEASRKLKEKLNVNVIDDESGGSNISLHDYHPNNPVPSSKAAIKHGPIQHDAPLIPYIPKPTPPGPDQTYHAHLAFP